MQGSIEYAAQFAPDLPHVVEMGVALGGTLERLRNLFPPKVQVIGFDSFWGLPEDWPRTKEVKGDFSTGGKAPAVPRTIILPGLFHESLPIYQTFAQPIALLHIDCDLYSSTSEALLALNRWIMAGTILVCDEWCYNHDPQFNDQEQKAVREWEWLCKRELDIIPFEDKTVSGDERCILKVVR